MSDESFYSSMSNLPKNKYKRTYSNLSLIFESFKILKIANIEHLPNLKDIPTNFWKKKSILFNNLKENYQKLNDYEITYISYVLLEEIECSPEYFLNIFDVMEKILSHFRYSLFILQNQIKRNFNNNYFDRFLITKFKYEEIFNIKNENERRKLKIDNKFFFNYGPIICKYKNCTHKNECPFSHNFKEIFYHPLIYKKIKCSLFDSCKEKNCPFFHSKNEMNCDLDFENDKKIIDLIKNLNSYEIKNNEIINESFFFSSNEFNPFTYKKKKCPFGKICKLNFCLNYHNLYEDRIRNFVVYDNILCPKIFEKNKLKENPNCNEKDNCKFCHSIFEFNFHPKNYKKIKCENFNNCKNQIFCPFLHQNEKEIYYNENNNENNFNNENNNENNENNENNNENNENNNKNILICDPEKICGFYMKKMNDYFNLQNKKIKELTNEIKLFMCSQCKKKNFLIEKKDFVITKTNDFICKNCFDELKKKYEENEFKYEIDITKTN